MCQSLESSSVKEPLFSLHIKQGKHEKACIKSAQIKINAQLNAHLQVSVKTCFQIWSRSAWLSFLLY